MTTPRGKGETDGRKIFAGTWKLVATECLYADGRRGPALNLGAKGVGYIFYSETGHMCAIVMNTERPKGGKVYPDQEAYEKGAPKGFHAYSGTYEVYPNEGFVVHHVEIDPDPNLVGTDRKRYFTLSGKVLTLRPSPPPEGVVDMTLTWERVH